MKISFIITIVFIIFYSKTFAQIEDWKVYNTSNSYLPDNQIQSVHIDKNNIKWLGTSSGLVRFDGSEWITYNKTNSYLPSDYITSIASDGDSGIWIGTDKGIAHLNGNTINVYSTNNSPLTSDNIIKILFASSSVWFCTDKGLIKYSKDEWTVYDENTSGLAIDFICSIVVDLNGTVWIGTFDHNSFNGYIWTYNEAGWNYFRLSEHGLFSSFPDALICDSNNQIWIGTKGTTGGTVVLISDGKWTIYNRNNSGFPGGGINSIQIEGEYKWIASGSGLISFGNGKWEQYNVNNSNIPDDFVQDVAVDKFGNKWIATLNGGLAVYKKGGIISSVKENYKSNDYEFHLLNNYPNPFNSSTIIYYSIPITSFVNIKVYDILGKEITTLVNENKLPGNYQINFYSSNLSSGVYLCKMESNNYIKTKKIILLK